MDTQDLQEANKKLLADADFSDAHKELLLKTSATFSRAEIKELEMLLQDAKTSSFIYSDMAYHR